MTVRELTEFLLAIPEDRKDLPIVVWESYFEGGTKEGTEGYCTPTKLTYLPYLNILNSDNPEREPGYAL